jgi:short-subunit dehydrogenase
LIDPLTIVGPDFLSNARIPFSETASAVWDAQLGTSDFPHPALSANFVIVFPGHKFTITIPLDRTREMISLNISALVELTYAFLQRAERGDGIIQVSSVLSFLPMPASAVYAATKAFVTSFSEGLWFSCRRKGIVIVNLCPGNTITKFAERAGWGKSEVPSWASQTAEAVSEKGIRAFERKSGPTIVSGSINHFVVFLTRIFSREMIVMITGRARKDPLNPKG